MKKQYEALELKYLFVFVIVAVLLLIGYLMPFQRIGLHDKLIPSFYEIAAQVANQTYIEDVYDCNKFSHDLIRNLTEEGYEAECAIGKVYQDHIYTNPNKTVRKYNYHAWVMVKVNNAVYPVEATTGRIINIDRYAENYRDIETGGRCDV